jgi:uncharacterized protein YjdB
MWRMFLSVFVLTFALSACSTGQSQPSAVPVGALTGVVTGPNGPVGGASIMVTSNDGFLRDASSTPDGYFEIDRLPAGTAQIAVTAVGYVAWQTTAAIAPNATTAQDVRLSPQ